MSDAADVPAAVTGEQAARRAAMRARVVASPVPGLLRLSHPTLGPALRWWLRMDVSGAEHVPREGGALLAANHRSFLDHFAMGAACPRPMRFLGKASLADGLAGRYNVAMGMIPLERGVADLEALKVVAAVLRSGAVVGVFPEGTRSTTGELFRFRSGMARIAAGAGVPIVPVGLRGTGEVWPRGQRLPSRSRPDRGVVSVAFGAPVSLPDDSARARRAATAAVYAAVARLSGQPEAGSFADIPDS